MKNLPKIQELARLLVALKANIGDEYRCTDDQDDDTPGMIVTIGWTPKTGEWNYQTGDNSFTGAAYGHRIWAVIYLYRDSNCRDLARDAQDELAEGNSWEGGAS
jgi:hypothetical protein